MYLFGSHGCCTIFFEYGMCGQNQDRDEGPGKFQIRQDHQKDVQGDQRKDGGERGIQGLLRRGERNRP